MPINSTDYSVGEHTESVFPLRIALNVKFGEVAENSDSVVILMSENLRQNSESTPKVVNVWIYKNKNILSNSY